MMKFMLWIWLIYSILLGIFSWIYAVIKPTTKERVLYLITCVYLTGIVYFLWKLFQ